MTDDARLRLAIHGAAGRMGQRLVALVSEDSAFQVVAALENSEHPRYGDDAGAVAGIGEIGVHLASQLPEDVDCVIDFSVPASAVQIVEQCRARQTPLVLATTGLDASQQERVTSAGREIPIVWAPSMSLAVNVAMKLVTTAAAALKHHPSGADVEVIERHHRFKEDAPSGTALRFGKLIADEMGQMSHQHGRSGIPGQRPHNEIGYHAIRVGDNPGEHTIVFGLLGETLEITVRATNRDCYALGALSAARFVAGKTPGIYSMNDVLGL